MSEINYHYDIAQGTDEWLNLRGELVTASNINTLLTPTGKPAKGKKIDEYAAKLIIAREFGFLDENFQSFDMMRGHIQEEIAREIYSENYAPTEECGFITREFNEFKIGASPDGLVGDDGGIEIKSRVGKFQISTIMADEVPAEYMNQIQTSLLVSGREWWDFVQYSNGMPLFVKRVFLDVDLCDKIIDAVKSFYDRVEIMTAEFKEKSSSLVPTEWVELDIGDDIITDSEVK